MPEILWVPFLACLVLTGIHAYLGLHVLARGVIFVDLALAQVAALGMAVAFLAGHPIQSDAAYWYALAFTLAGAALFAGTRTSHAHIPQEAIIGIVYAVSAAAAILVVDRAPQGGEHIKQLLVGSILTVTSGEVGRLALLYAIVGALHWLARRPLLEISLDPDGAAAAGRRIGLWDFLFYASFGLVVTSSVRVAGVLLVFAYLIVPAAVGALLTASVAGRLAVGWALGFGVSVLGLWSSFVLDLPTGATVVATFGMVMALVALGRWGFTLARAMGTWGWRALAGPATIVFGAVSLAGLLLLAFPRMDHHWLNWLEDAAPAVRLAFLTPYERAVHAESLEALRRGQAELARLRALQEEVQWGTRELPEEMKERLRQFLASRGEIAAGDRLVLHTLRRKARERQRLWLGLPLFLVGCSAALLLWGRVLRAPIPGTGGRRGARGTGLA
jgi:zinc/manganese transport system permease protein